MSIRTTIGTGASLAVPCLCARRPAPASAAETRVRARLQGAQQRLQPAAWNRAARPRPRSSGTSHAPISGPTEYDEAKQVQLAQDIITRGVDGLGISAGNPKAMARIMKMAKDKGIPVVTFDTDVLPEDAGLTVDLYRHRQLRVRRCAGPEGAGAQEEGGTVCIQSGAPGLREPQGPHPGHSRHARGRRPRTSRSTASPARTAGPSRRVARSTTMTTSPSRPSRSAT